jgi:hypothetical protein
MLQFRCALQFEGSSASSALASIMAADRIESAQAGNSSQPSLKLKLLVQWFSTSPKAGPWSPSNFSDPQPTHNMQIVNFIANNWQDLGAGLALVIGGARIIVKITPTPKDDSILDSVVGFLKHVGLHIDSK